MRQNNLRTEVLIGMFMDQHLTLREIAKQVGMSAGAVGKRLRNAGVKREDGTWAECTCVRCGR